MQTKLTAMTAFVICEFVFVFYFMQFAKENRHGKVSHDSAIYMM